MYKIVANPRAWWPVTWPGVSEEGEVVENRIEMRFVIHSEDDHQALINEVSELSRRADESVGEEKQSLSFYYTELVQRIAVDWRGVLAENGEPLKWEQENIRLLMNQPGVFAASVAGYRSCRTGGKEVREGN